MTIRGWDYSRTVCGASHGGHAGSVTMVGEQVASKALGNRRLTTIRGPPTVSDILKHRPTIISISKAMDQILDLHSSRHLINQNVLR